MLWLHEHHVMLRPLTVLMWFSRTFEIAWACSVFSLAMMVRLLISYLLLPCRSFKASSKSAATSVEDEAPDIEPRGDLEDMMTSREGYERLHDAEKANYGAAIESNRRQSDSRRANHSTRCRDLVAAASRGSALRADQCKSSPCDGRYGNSVVTGC